MFSAGNVRAFAVLLLIPFLWPLSAAAAQQPAQQPSAPQPPREQSQEPIETLQVNVNVVNVFCNVKDKRGALVPNLKKEDFELYEDKKKQTIKYFSAESNQPLTLGILIDTSGSQQRVLPMEQQVGGEFLKEVLREKDLAFLISFDVNVELLQDFTASAEDLRRAMERVRINTGGGAAGGAPGVGQGPFPTSSLPRGTLLYDAIYLAAQEKLSREVGRKAMIILTDGADFGSKLRIRDAIEAAQKADAICYVLLIADRGFYGGGYSGDDEMKKLTADTGGRMIEVGNEREKLKKAFDQISNELRTQYSLGYTPSNNKKDGTFRRIEIRTSNAEQKVQARRGYYALAER
jgi:VWFA-related protein